ncbi:MAG: lipid-A-disaccharide synthase [Candidatus Paracaedibacteraceae bacterium]|nr:lipid-A-disaccharide synthase [Candidatus Paracaedibacteraceae bacterium]
MTTKIYIIAGEASGDLLGSTLATALSARTKNITLRGIGGELMRNQNIDTLFHYDEISVMGLIELIPHIRRIKKLIQRTIDDICAFKPDVLVTIDSSGFCNRVIAGVEKRMDIPSVHYVAPPVWAWRPKRAKRLAKWGRIKHLMCLFPFEPPYFTVHGLQTTVVGHPIVTIDWSADPTIHKTLGLDPCKKNICLLPGSRHSEIKRHLTIFAKAVEGIDANIIVPTFDKFAAEVKLILPAAYVITDSVLKQKTMILADVALAASGTVSLELAMAKTPMIIAYRASWFTAVLLKRLLKVSSVCLVNILLDKKVIVEYLQKACNAKDLKEGLLALLKGKNPDGTLSEQTPELFDKIKDLLTPRDGKNPSETAAEVVLSYVSK